MKLNAAQTLAAIARETYISVGRVHMSSRVTLLSTGKVATFVSTASGSVFYAAPDFARDGFKKVTS